MGARGRFGMVPGSSKELVTPARNLLFFCLLCCCVVTCDVIKVEGILRLSDHPAFLLQLEDLPRGVFHATAQSHTTTTEKITKVVGTNNETPSDNSSYVCR